MGEIEAEIEEGYVVRFESGLRLKVKCADYVRLHRLITGVNAKVIWELLRNNQPFDDLLSRVPDEFYAWVVGIRAGLIASYATIEQQAQKVYLEVKNLPTRKEQAEYALRSTRYAAVVFKMLDGKDYDKVIWGLIKPKAERPFKEEVEGEA